MKRSRVSLVSGISLLGFAFVLSCGRSNSGSDSSSAAQSNLGPLIQIPISLTENTATALMLNMLGLAAPGGVNVDSYSMTLASCSSGLTGSTSASTINVYLHDSNCKAQLSSFVLHGQSYVPTGTGSSPFTTWAAADTAIFRGASDTDLINVKVVSQLSSPINTSDIVSYNFSIIKSGTNSASITVSNAQTLYAAGQDAPNFKINASDIIFDNIVSSGGNTGAGQFTFKLTCFVSTMTVGANVSYNSFCPTVTAGGTIAGGDAGVDVGNSSAFSYKLIADPNNNGTLTLAQAQAAFASGDSTVTLATDILGGSTGFKTSSLTGPVTIVSNPKMILILQAKNTNPSYSSNPAYSSFQYFAMTLPTVTP